MIIKYMDSLEQIHTAPVEDKLLDATHNIGLAGVCSA
jgi:hypothetical protein